MPRDAAWKLTWTPARESYECWERSSNRMQKQAIPPADDRQLQEWLGRISSFAFSGRAGTCTARKELSRGGHSYWYTYRRNGKQLQKKYLGKSDAITIEQLERVASSFGAARGESVEEVAASSTIIEPGQPVHWDDPLLGAKLRMPHPPPFMLLRPQLIDCLRGALVRPLTLVSASAGSGKTTLLSGWLSQQTGVDSAWITLERQDDEPDRVWRLIFTAFERLCPGSGEGPLALLRTRREPNIERMLATLLNQLESSERHMLLVLDDYHVLTGAAIAQSMAFLLEHLPGRVHVVISTRVDPPLPLSRLRLRGHLLELRDADLLLTPSETQAFLTAGSARQIATEESDLLFARTEGWIAALQLVAILLHQRSTPMSVTSAWSRGRRHIADYLVHEVLQQLPESTQRFLLRTSILERLSGQLCEAVAEQTNGQGMLEWLQRANLFLNPLDNDRHWYRYHQLFAETLREQLRQREPELEVDLHRRAMKWFAEHDMVGEAIGHAKEIGDVEGIAALAETAGIAMIERNETSSIMPWVNLLPRETLFSHPILLVYVCWDLIASNRYAVAAEMLDEYARLHGIPLLDTTDAAGLEKGIYAHMVASEVSPIHLDTRGASTHVERFLQLYATLAILRDDRVAFSREINQRATQYLPGPKRVDGGDSWLVALWQGDIHGAITRLEEELASMIANTHNVLGFSIVTTLAQLLLMTGNLYKIAQIADGVLQANRTINIRMHHGPSHVALGQVDYERNNVEQAEEHLERGLELCRQFENFESFLSGLQVLVKMRVQRGDAQGAKQLLRENESMVRSIGEESGDLSRATLLFRASVALSLGEVSEAQHWMQDIDIRFDPGSQWNFALEASYMTQVRILLSSAEWQEADSVLRWLEDAAARQQRRGSLISISILRSLLEQSQGRLEPALASLGRALVYGQVEGYRRVFLDEGTPMHELLTAFRRARGSAGNQPVTLSYLDRLIRLQSAELVGWNQDSSVDALTRRELEVLQLVSEGWSNGDIACRLVITDSTVKSHLNTIYSKLQIHSRTQAIVRARALRLLS